MKCVENLKQLEAKLTKSIYIIDLDVLWPIYFNILIFGQLFAKIEKQIQIDDLDNSIHNSTPALPVVVTSEEVTTNFTGGLVYLNDLEGKITKFNLTNMSTDNQNLPIAMYDSTTLFNVGATPQNGRYMYHSMDAAIGGATNSLWLYAGTGDYERIADRSTGVQNLLLGIKDENWQTKSPACHAMSLPAFVYTKEGCFDKAKARFSAE